MNTKTLKCMPVYRSLSTTDTPKRLDKEAQLEKEIGWGKRETSVEKFPFFVSTAL
jgi:hypothetical protein